MSETTSLWRQLYANLGSTRDRVKYQELWIVADSAQQTVRSQILLQCARQDQDVERLIDVASVLARLGPPAMRLVVEELEKASPTTSSFFVETLLQAVRHSSTRLDKKLRIELIVKFSDSLYDADVRESAYSLVHGLPPDLARSQIEQLVGAESRNDLKDLLLNIWNDLMG